MQIHVCEVRDDVTHLCKLCLCMSDAKVLEQDGAIDLVETVVRKMSVNGFSVICADDRAFREVIGNVAADWTARLLGDVQVCHYAEAVEFTAANFYSKHCFSAIVLHYQTQS